MRKVIGGKVYDTKKAELVAKYETFWAAFAEVNTLHGHMKPLSLFTGKTARQSTGRQRRKAGKRR